MSDLLKAIYMALENHADQMDKTGKPYYLHPLRVMSKMEKDDERIVAVLHDIIEDTPITSIILTEDGFSDKIVDAIVAITHIPGEPYVDYIERVANDPIARKVKIADLEDNMSIDRMLLDDDRALARLRKYRDAWLLLRQIVNEGSRY